jgi:predicted phage baseplate assembly protein
VTQRTPLEVENRPGLSAIAYRVGVHRDFLASMIAGLTDADRPRLAELGTRDRDDFSIALLDAWAVAADVLAFYNERLAQESYLRTARQRISLQELGRLIGYRLRPGVAAETFLAFALEPPPDVPAAATRDPGSAPPVTPTRVVLEPGLRVQSIPGPGEQPQTFETVEEVEARPEWNAIPASTTTPGPALASTHAYLRGVGLNLKPGDVFLVATAAAPSGSFERRSLTAVEENAARDRTRVSWIGSLTAPAGPKAHVLRKRLSIFGHNAPHQERITPGSSDWSFVLSAETASGTYVDLDGSQPDVAPESLVVISQPGVGSQLWKVAEATELSRADYAISGKVTRLELTGSADISAFGGKARITTVYAVNEPLDLAETPDGTPVASNAIDVTADVSGLAPGRRLIVRGTTTAGEEHAEAAAVKEIQAGGSRIVLDEGLSETYARDTVVVHANVAMGTHGETVEQLLGSGGAASPFQRFTLSHEPLTHVQSTAAPSGAEAALEVRVNDVRWDEVPTLYAAAPGDRAYVLRADETGAAYVQFGDGERGSRLPTGSHNVRARYRKGLGAGGNVKAGALAQLLDRPLGVKGVANPAPASGGVDPESEEAARASIPLGVRTLGRAVSLLDYEDFARAFTGVVKARAAVLALRGGRTIVVTVAFEGGERLEDLSAALRTHGDPRVEVRVLAATSQTFRLALSVAVDPAWEAEAVLAGVDAALRETNSFEARGLTEPVFRSELVAAAHTVPGVLAVDVDLLYTGTAPGLADRLLAQRPAVGPGGTPIAAGLLELDPAPFDWLKVMA